MLSVVVVYNLLFEFTLQSFHYFLLFFFFKQAEAAQAEACEKFETMSACGKEELVGFRNRRVQAFKKR